MRWKPAITIACLLVVCAGSFLCWQHKLGPVKRIKALSSRAAQGDAKAQFHLSSAYYRGKGVPQDYAVAFRWYKMAADQGEPDAEDGLGYMYVTGRGTKQDYAEALRWYKRAAEHGDAKGEFDLATVYDDGIGLSSDYIEASRWFRKAADQNYAKGQDGLGMAGADHAHESRFCSRQCSHNRRSMNKHGGADEEKAHTCAIAWLSSVSAGLWLSGCES